MPKDLKSQQIGKYCNGEAVLKIIANLKTQLNSTNHYLVIFVETLFISFKKEDF